MARVNIDSPFFSDPRVDRLASISGESKFTTRGRLIEIWHYCYNQTQEVLTSDEVNLHGGWSDTNCYGDLMVKAHLAEKTSSGYRIRGTKERFNYIIECRENGRRGGKISAAKRANKHPSEGQGGLNPPLSELNPLPLDHVLDTPPHPLIGDEETVIIEETRSLLLSLFKGVIPSDIESEIPLIIKKCNYDKELVHSQLNDIFQNNKVRTGEGLTSSHSSYLSTVLRNHFGLNKGAL